MINIMFGFDIKLSLADINVKLSTKGCYYV